MINTVAQLASQQQFDFAELQYYKYLSNDDFINDAEIEMFDDTSVRQEDARLSYLKNQMEKQPTENNVYALVDEITQRKTVDDLFADVFPE